MGTRPLSRSIRMTASGNAITRQTTMSAYEVVANGGDVVVYFRNGVGGEILWAAEADASSGSKSHDFSRPLLFTRGIYVDIPAEAVQFLNSVYVAVVEPQSSGIE